jgi:hypothetical protein
MGTAVSAEGKSVGDLLHRITDDVKVIAKDEVELAKAEITSTARKAAADAAVIVLGGIVALIGFGLLCLAAVAALEPVIHALSLRLLLMAFVYLIGGGIVAGVFAKRLGADAKPDLKVPGYEAKRTIAGAKEALSH